MLWFVLFLYNYWALDCFFLRNVYYYPKVLLLYVHFDPKYYTL